MKIKDGFVLREVAGENMVIATGEPSREFFALIWTKDLYRDISYYERLWLYWDSCCVRKLSSRR